MMFGGQNDQAFKCNRWHSIIANDDGDDDSDNNNDDDVDWYMYIDIVHCKIHTCKRAHVRQKCEHYHKPNDDANRSTWLSYIQALKIAAIEIFDSEVSITYMCVHTGCTRSCTWPIFLFDEICIWCISSDKWSTLLRYPVRAIEYVLSLFLSL